MSIALFILYIILISVRKGLENTNISALYQKGCRWFKSRIQGHFSAYNEHCSAGWATAETPNGRERISLLAITVVYGDIWPQAYSPSYSAGNSFV